MSERLTAEQLDLMHHEYDGVTEPYQLRGCDLGLLVMHLPALLAAARENERLRELIDSESLRKLLGHIEDYGGAVAWSYAQAWMQERDDARGVLGKEE